MTSAAPPAPTPPAPAGLRRRPEAGLSLVDVTLALGVLTLVVLGHVWSTLSQHRLSGAQVARSAALRAAGQLCERLRSDPDWAGLYTRLRVLQAAVGSTGIPDAPLGDGRRTYALTTYYADLEAPRGITALVEVPSGSDQLTGAPTLREDADLPPYLLPADLNGDGRIDDAALAGDYVFLPVKVTVRWEGRSVGGSEQLSSLLYLRGER